MDNRVDEATRALAQIVARDILSVNQEMERWAVVQQPPKQWSECKELLLKIADNIANLGKYLNERNHELAQENEALLAHIKRLKRRHRLMVWKPTNVRKPPSKKKRKQLAAGTSRRKKSAPVSKSRR